MPELMIVLSCLALAGLLLTTGCASRSPVGLDRKELLGILEHEMRHNEGWVRIHAADALLDHHQRQVVAQAFAGEQTTAGLPSRIGVWRVLWRAAETQAERMRYQEAIRKVAADPQASDRLAAVETLARLGLGKALDQRVLMPWLESADDASAPYLHWFLCLSSSTAGQAHHEGALVSLLDSPDPVARLRAGFALGRLPKISEQTYRSLAEHAEAEPANSIARAYLLSAALQQTPRGSASEPGLIKQSLCSLETGKPAEQLETAVVLGRRGTREASTVITLLLKSREADARIGAASGLLYLTGSPLPSKQLPLPVYETDH